jgi:hypothetical protein
MADKRIKDLAATATAPAGDDFIAIDGETNNTRKIAADLFLQDAPSDGTLYGRQDGDWEEAASPDDIPLTATFVYDGTAGTTEFIVGNIPDSWQSSNGDLTQLSIGNSVTSIGSYAFYVCTGFTGSLTLGNSVTSIGSRAFYSCNGFTGNLIFPTSLISIGDSAFTDCPNLTGGLIFSNSLTSIGGYAFGASGGFTGNIVIPSSATVIGQAAFIDCNGLTDAYLNQPIGSIGSYAFYGTSITNVYIGPDATGYTLGSGQTIGNKSGITVSVWTNYPNVP